MQIETYDGMELIELYARECVEKHGVSNTDYFFDLRHHTKITYVAIADDGLQLRFETEFFGCWTPVCQYAYWRDGRLQFRDDRQWFIPGDVVFDSFEAAIKFAKEAQVEPA